MIIAFDKALNLHRRSNTPSRVAIVFECNGAENYVTLTWSSHMWLIAFVELASNTTLHNNCMTASLLKFLFKYIFFHCIWKNC